MAERLPTVGFQHTPSLTRFSLNRKTLRPLGQFIVQTRVRKTGGLNFPCAQTDTSAHYYI